eukprot:8826477-Prorocentrum_lima.AAC.1
MGRRMLEAVFFLGTTLAQARPYYLRLTGFDGELDFDAFLHQSAGRDVFWIVFGVFPGPLLQSRIEKTFLTQWARGGTT